MSDNDSGNNVMTLMNMQTVIMHGPNFVPVLSSSFLIFTIVIIKAEAN